MGLWQRRAHAGPAGSAWPPALAATVVLELRPPRPHVRTGSRPCGPSWSWWARSGVVAILCPAAAARRPEAGHRPRGRARLRRRAGRAAVLDRGHRGHAAQRGHPVGDPDRRRADSAGPVAVAASPGGGFPGGGFRRAFGGGGFPGGGTFPAAAFPGGGFRPAAAGTGHRSRAASPAVRHRSAPAAGSARRLRWSGGGGRGGGFLNSSQSNAALNKAAAGRRRAATPGPRRR